VTQRPIASAVVCLMDQPEVAREVAFPGMRRAEARFEVRRYAEEIASVATELVSAAAPARAGLRARVAQT
jgi:hypothetical protein